MSFYMKMQYISQLYIDNAKIIDLYLIRWQKGNKIALDVTMGGRSEEGGARSEEGGARRERTEDMEETGEFFDDD